MLGPKIERAVSVALEKLGYSQLHILEQYEVAQQFLKVCKSLVNIPRPQHSMGLQKPVYFICTYGIIIAKKKVASCSRTVCEVSGGSLLQELSQQKNMNCIVDLMSLDPDHISTESHRLVTTSLQAVRLVTTASRVGLDKLCRHNFWNNR